MMLDTTDARTLKAIEIAATAERWFKGRTRDGQKFYAIPSSSGHVYWTNLQRCTCPDSQRGHVCKHRRAVAIHVARVRAQQPRTVAKAANPAKAPAPVDLDAERRKRLAAQYDALYGNGAA